LPMVINLSPHRSCGAGDLLKKLMLAGLLAVLGLAPAFALAATQGDKKMVVGRVQRVDVTGTAITLTDGTKLLTPPGSIAPGLERSKRTRTLPWGRLSLLSRQRPANRRSGTDRDGEHDRSEGRADA